MRNRLIAGIGSAVLALGALPAAALAQAQPIFDGDEDQAEAAVAAAQAKIDTNEKQGVTADAADQQARAREALAEAVEQLKDDDEDHAFHSAREAIALADLATVTAELKRLTTERDKPRSQ